VIWNISFCQFGISPGEDTTLLHEQAFHDYLWVREPSISDGNQSTDPQTPTNHRVGRGRRQMHYWRKINHLINHECLNDRSICIYMSLWWNLYLSKKTRHW
jgi:hypothetical protein